MKTLIKHTCIFFHISKWDWALVSFNYHNPSGKITLNVKKSCYDSAHICPIRAEISTHEHWENVFILLFVWLVVMGFRHNFFHKSPNFGDFGAKMSFFRYIINQKRKIFIKHCSPPCSKTPLISEMCIYITHNLCKWGHGTRGGGGNNVLQTKNGGRPASSAWNTVIANGKLHHFDKIMKFCILVVHDLTNYISYDAKLNRSKNCYFWGKIVKILWKKIARNGKIFVLSIFVHILV